MEGTETLCSPCHNLEPSLVARDSSRLLSVKPNQWTHLPPFYTRMHGECLRYAKSTSQFHWRFLLIRDDRGFQVNPLCRHDITSPFPPSGNGGYVRNLDVFVQQPLSIDSNGLIHIIYLICFLAHVIKPNDQRSKEQHIVPLCCSAVDVSCTLFYTNK